MGIYKIPFMGCAIDNKDILIAQSLEMYKTIINILIQNKELCFTAEMFHFTSYQFYLIMLEKGYIEEIGRMVNGYDLKWLEKIKFRLFSEKNNFDKMVSKGLIVSNNGTDKISHDIMFMMSDKFIEKYDDENILKKCR